MKAAALCLAMAFWCTGATAYVLPGRAVLDHYVRNFGKEKRLLVRQQIRVRTDTQNPGEILVDETARYRFPDAFRLDAVSGEIQRVHLFVDGETLTLLDGKPDPVSQSRLDRYGELILCRNRVQAERLLMRYGIDPDICSLGRFQGSTAYVIGARYPDVSVSQLWIDKETFWPIRWLFVEGEERSPGETLEIRYLSWAKEGTAWYPRRAEFYRNGVPERILEIRELEIDPPFERDLFDVARLRSMVAPAAEPGMPSGETDRQPDEIKKTIEKFKKIYE